MQDKQGPSDNREIKAALEIQVRESTDNDIKRIAVGLNETDLKILSEIEDEKVKNLLDFYSAHISRFTDPATKFAAACDMFALNAKDLEQVIDKQAYEKKISALYRRKALEFHPDRFPSIKENKTVENLVHNVMAMVNEAKGVLDNYASEISKRNAEELRALFSRLEAHNINEFLNREDIQSRLNSIDNSHHLAAIQINLSGSLKKAFWTSSAISKLFNQLPLLIKSSGALSEILFCLPEAQKEAFWKLPDVVNQLAKLLLPGSLLQDLPEGLRSISGINSNPGAYDLAKILSYMPAEKVHGFLTLPEVYEQLPNLIKNIMGLDAVLESLQGEGREKSYELISNLEFVKTIKEDDERVKLAEKAKITAMQETIRNEHPDLLIIEEVLKSLKENGKELDINVEIHMRTSATPGYQVRIIALPSPSLAALNRALEQCSEKYGLSVKGKNKGENKLLVIQKDNESTNFSKDNFAQDLQKAYEDRLPIEIHKFNLNSMASLIKRETENLSVETSQDSEATIKNISELYLKISTEPAAELAAVRVALKGCGVNVEREEREANSVKLWLTPDNKLLRRQFYTEFKETYQENLAAQNSSILSKTFNKQPQEIPVEVKTEASPTQKPEQIAIQSLYGSVVTNKPKSLAPNESKIKPEDNQFLTELSQDPSFQALRDKMSAIEKRRGRFGQSKEKNDAKYAALSEIFERVHDKEHSVKSIYQYIRENENIIKSSTRKDEGFTSFFAASKQPGSAPLLDAVLEKFSKYLESRNEENVSNISQHEKKI